MDAVAGVPAPLTLTLADGASGLFPAARVANALGAVVAGPLALTPVPGLPGTYQVPHTFPAPGQFTVVFRVYADAGLTVEAPYEVAQDAVRVRELDPDETGLRLLGHAGENVRDDVLAYDVNGRPLTFRRRLFASAAAASASTPGGTGEGELLTVVGAAAHLDAGRWETLLRTVAP